MIAKRREQRIRGGQGRTQTVSALLRSSDYQGPAGPPRQSGHPSQCDNQGSAALTQGAPSVVFVKRLRWPPALGSGASARRCRVGGARRAGEGSGLIAIIGIVQAERMKLV